MAITNLPPIKTKLLEGTGLLTIPWLTYFNNLSRNASIVKNATYPSLKITFKDNFVEISGYISISGSISNNTTILNIPNTITPKTVQKMLVYCVTTTGTILPVIIEIQTDGDLVIRNLTASLSTGDEIQMGFFKYDV